MKAFMAFTLLAIVASVYIYNAPLVARKHAAAALLWQMLATGSIAVLVWRWVSVWCVFFDRNLHSRMQLDPTHVRLKLLHVCDQWHSSRVSTPLTGWHCKLRPNTEGR
jgi:hypothetical protein